MSGPGYTKIREGEHVELPSNNPTGALKYENVTIRPIGVSPTGVLPGSSVSFTFTPSATKWWNPNDSYLTFRVRHDINGGVVAATSLVTLVPLVPAALLRGMSLEMAGTKIDSIADNLAATAAYVFRTSEQKAQEKVGRLCGWGHVQSASGLTAASEPASTRGNRLRATRKQLFMWKPPMGVFNRSELLPPCEYRITLEFDPNMVARALQINETANTRVLSIAATTAASGTDGTHQRQIHFNVEDVEFNACMIDFGDRGRLTSSMIIDTTNIWTNAINLATNSTSDDLLVRVKPSTTKNTVAFVNPASRTGANGADPDDGLENVCTLFSPTSATGVLVKGGVPPPPVGGAGTNTPFNILGLGMEFGGNTAVPSGQLRLLYNVDDGDHMIKAYNFWAEASGLSDPENYRTYLTRGPMYSFGSINVKDPSSKDIDLRVRVDRQVQGESTLMYVFSEYENAIVVKVENERIIDVTLSER